MKATELQDQLRSLPTPPGSHRRVGLALASALPPRRRRWRLPLASIAALAGVLTLTTPGQATVDWVAEAVHLQEASYDGIREDESGRFGQAVTLGTGTDPGGRPYSVQVLPTGRGAVCMMLELSPEASPQNFVYLDESSCGTANHEGEPSIRTNFFPLSEGGVAAFGLVDSDAASATVSSAGGEQIGVDLFPLAGDLSQRDGSTVSLPSLTAFVAFPPAGVGDVEEGAAATLSTRSAEGEAIGSVDLAWAKVGEGDSAQAYDCGATGLSPVGLCEDARAGELNRVDERLAQAVPADVAAQLGDAGYLYRPAVDADRETAADPEFELRPRTPFAISAFLGIGYRIYLGRVDSVSGAENRLVYILPDFPRDRLPGDAKVAGGGAATSATGTFIVDAITGETLAELRRPTP